METKQIFTAITSIMQEVDAIAKNQQNTEQKYKFRGIDDVYNALHPLFKKHKVFVTTEVLSERREQMPPSKTGAIAQSCYLSVKFTYFTDDGSSVSSTTQGEGRDYGDKATNKAMSAAQKYSLIQMFLIPTVEASTDSEADAPAAAEEIAKAEEMKKSLELMKQQILLITEIPALQKYWADNVEFHKNKEFNTAVQARKAALVKPIKK